MGFLEIPVPIVTNVLIRFAFSLCLAQQGFYRSALLVYLRYSFGVCSIGEYFPMRRSGFRWINVFTKEYNFCSSFVGCSFIPNLLVIRPCSLVSSALSGLIHLFPYFICSLRVALTAYLNHAERYVFIADSLNIKLHSYCASSSSSKTSAI